MNAAESAVPVSQVEIAKQRALRRSPPLATRAENIKQAVENLPDVNLTPAAPVLGWRNQRFNQRPFRIREVARIAKTIPIIFPAVSLHPHGITNDSNHSTSLWTDIDDRQHKPENSVKSHLYAGVRTQRSNVGYGPTHMPNCSACLSIV